MAKRASIGINFDDYVVSEEDDKGVEAISTGSLSLDACIGIGGIPRGRFTEIFGPESAGKTTLCLSIAGQAIKKGLKVLYVDIERGLDYKYINKIIGESHKGMFQLSWPETAEEALLIVEEGILSKEYGLVILDSIGALAPEKEKEDKLTDSNVGLVPRILSKFSRRSAFGVHKNNVAVIMINQVRDKIGAYIPTLETPGGHAIKHLYSLRISLYYPQKIQQGDEIIGMNTRFTVKKNKLAPDGRSFYFPIIHGKGLDYGRDVVNFAVELGVVEKNGSWLSYEGQNLGQGTDKTVKYLEENGDTLDKIIQEVYNIINSVNSTVLGKENNEQDD